MSLFALSNSQIHKFSRSNGGNNGFDHLRSRRGRRDEAKLLAPARENREKDLLALKLSSTVQISVDQSRSYKSWPVQCYLALPVRRTDISRTPPRNIPMWGGLFCAARGGGQGTKHMLPAVHSIYFATSFLSRTGKITKGKGLWG